MDRYFNYSSRSVTTRKWRVERKVGGSPHQLIRLAHSFDLNGNTNGNSRMNRKGLIITIIRYLTWALRVVRSRNVTCQSLENGDSTSLESPTPRKTGRGELCVWRHTHRVRRENLLARETGRMRQLDDGQVYLFWDYIQSNSLLVNVSMQLDITSNA